MLYDRGLQTPEQIKKYHEYMDIRGKSILNGTFATACVGERLCENCNHLISDSICLCVGVFTCPNCGFKNGKEIEENIKKMRDMPYSNSLNMSILVSKDSVLKLLDDYQATDEYIYASVIKEIQKL